MFGLLNLDKPPGDTSRDVVNRVQRLVRPEKVGHCGTLDPLASGVLVVAIGQATRLVEYVQRLPKTYQATFLLGRESNTEDIEGDVVELPSPAVPSGEQIVTAARQFVGTIQQQPPAFSALKVGGQRAYDVARRGGNVELAPRPIAVYSMEVLRYDYPELELRIECGSGTYVRSLGRDLARVLGTGAVMSALRRLAIGPFRADRALAGGELTRSAIESHLLSPVLALGDMPHASLDERELARIAQGQSVANRWQLAAGEIAALNAENRLAAILIADGRGGLRPAKYLG
jgi:tRNA pseudouridine55 synthase